jgi:hypothetical protein
VRHHVQSALQSTTSFFALKKNSLTALYMQAAKHSHALRHKEKAFQWSADLLVAHEGRVTVRVA